jgi:hypothetical protein
MPPDRVIFHHCMEDEVCERCGRNDRAVVRLIPMRVGTDLLMCVICLADAIEHVTGWQAHNQVVQWHAAAMISRLIREERNQSG